MVPAKNGPPPDFGLYLLGRPAPAVAWQARWVRWADFWLASDPAVSSR